MKRGLGIYLLVILLAVWILLPIYYMVIISFEYRVEAYSQPAHLFPQVPTISNYLRDLGQSAFNVLTNQVDSAAGYPVKEALMNTTIVASAVALVTVGVASPAGYALGRLRLPRKNLWVFALLGSRTLPPVSIIIPFYILGISLGLIGNLPGLGIVELSATLPIMSWILMGLFASLPTDVENQARIDGCTRWQAMWRVVFPMARSGMVAVGLLTFLFVYNDFLYSWILVQGTPATTLQPVFASMWFMVGEINLMSAANSLGLILPIAIALVFQRYITQLRIVDPASMVLE